MKKKTFFVYGVITEKGEWIEKDWDDPILDLDFEDNFYDKFIKHLDKNMWITVVDIHI